MGPADVKHLAETLLNRRFIMENLESWIALGCIFLFIIAVFAAVMFFMGPPSNMDGGL